MDEIATQTIDAIQKLAQPKHPRAGPTRPMPDDGFQALRARTRGAIIAAHHELDPREWSEADDRMLDMVTAWLDNLKGRL